ncbi:PAS domain-containing protein [bacterium]|nr:PAS domain-containing protein [bacterium]
MKEQSIPPTGRERLFGEEEIIVSKTDRSGRVVYANEVFLRVAGFQESEVLGQQHNIIRHPDMPRCVFRYMWDVLEEGREIFAYVVNQCKNGDHYWVFAHVTPSFDSTGEITGYHSNRRFPDRDAVKIASEIYRELRALELAEKDPRKGLQKSYQAFLDLLEEKKISYDQFVFSLSSNL